MKIKRDQTTQPNPLIAEIHAIRATLLDEFNGDLRAYSNAVARKAENSKANEKLIFAPEASIDKLVR